MDELSNRRYPGLPLVALVVEGRTVNPQGILAVRMLPAKQYGGALVGIGERVAISWDDVERHGLGAFRDVWLVHPGAPENGDFAPGRRNLRTHKTLLLEIEPDQVILSPQGTWTKPLGAREQDRIRLALPVGGRELTAAVRDGFARR